MTGAAVAASLQRRAQTLKAAHAALPPTFNGAAAATARPALRADVRTRLPRRPRPPRLGVLA